MTEHNPNPWHKRPPEGAGKDDLRVRWFVVAVVGFVLFAAVTHVAIWKLVKSEVDVRPVDRARSAVSGYRATPTPPLQPTPNHDHLPQEDLEAMRQREDHVFESLGWRVDEAKHHATPPDALVQLVAARSHRSQGPQ